MVLAPDPDSAPGSRSATAGPAEPLAGAHADESGAVTWPAVPAGLWHVAIREPGVVPTETAVEVVAGERVETTVTESRGATIDLLVVDESGEPLPFASARIVQPSLVEWLDVSDDDVERVDEFVDIRGRRSLAHVEPGDAQVVVTRGARTTNATVHTTDASTSRVTVTLR